MLEFGVKHIAMILISMTITKIKFKARMQGKTNEQNNRIENTNILHELQIG